MEISKSRDLANEVISRFNVELGHLNYRPIFGGYGISQYGVIFALVYNGRFYLKAAGKLVDEYVQKGMPQLIMAYANKQKPLQYYGVTREQWHDKQLLMSLVKHALTTIVAEQRKENRVKATRLREYPNISMSLERLLNKVGIMDFEMLRFIGAVDVYLKLKSCFENININVMFQLDAAINGCHVAVLPEIRKNALLHELGIISTNQLLV